ncbi:ATP-binding cassette domain-containing protein, partial [Streptomyces sp. AF1A]|uniref:ABC transporter ATP-binding protein n=1 Tax=Streptomyces sp. AF1A TaxID=3394350 RepID=UPI0039BD0072
MIQAFGLTSNSRKARPPAVDDVSFEAPAGQVTTLLGAAGAGKTTALRLMLELQQGRGITYFKGRPLHRIAHPSWEVGVLLGDVPGHPARSVRGHLRMLCAASGVPARRADEVLEVVGLVSFREERLGTLSRGMDRRLGLACALLPDPHTLVLDEPAEGLSAREANWLHSMLRAHAEQGGTVLMTTADPKEAARTADRVVTLDGGRMVADQAARDFARNRLRPRVAVRSPHAARLAALLAKEARTNRRSVEVVREGGNRLSVYGSTTADVGDTAFRHGILIHQLADEVGDMGAGAGAGRDGVTDAESAAPEREPAVPDAPPADAQQTVPDTRPGERKRPVPTAPPEQPEPAGDRPPVERGRAVFGFSASEPVTAALGPPTAERRYGGAGGTQREDTAPAPPATDSSTLVLRRSTSEPNSSGLESSAARHLPARGDWSTAERSAGLSAVPSPEQGVGEASESLSKDQAAATSPFPSEVPDGAAAEPAPAEHTAPAAILSDERAEAAADRSSGEPGQDASRLAPADEERASPVHSAWERGQVDAGEHSSHGTTPGHGTVPDRKDTARASASSGADAEADDMARAEGLVGSAGENSSAAPVEALARAEGGPAAAATTVADAGRPRAVAESRPGSVRTLVGIPASRS